MHKICSCVGRYIESDSVDHQRGFVFEKLYYRRFSAIENEMVLFQHEEFGEVRTLNLEDELWFVGKDVCKLLGDSNHNRNLSRIDDEDNRMVELTDSLGRNQIAIAVNESGLYAYFCNAAPKGASRWSSG